MIFDFESAEAFTSCVYETAAPIHAILSNQSQEKRKAILKSVIEAAANKYPDKSSSSVNLCNEVICIVGKRYRGH